MTAEQISSVAQECYDRAVRTGRPSRDVAREIVARQDPDLVLAMAVELVVDAVARAQRQATLDAERRAQGEPSLHEAARPWPMSPMPRKGTTARRKWETETPEGRAYAEQCVKDQIRADQMMMGVIGNALNRYAEDLRIQWTAELLDSTFTLADGTPVAWGEATVEQHAERRQMFLNNAHANMEGAARHEVALRELQASGKPTLRDMVGAAA